ncbi:MAG: NAD(P)H-hydrate dehydratase [Clostridia bacterium]|nr:NAD(P)H-hydrate dehydratase [Clostridia bacterium]
MKIICSREQTRNNDYNCIQAGVSSLKLMLNAGKALLYAHNYTDKKTLIVSGGGNNGGDGLVLALLLKEKGCDVKVCLAKSNFTEESVYYYGKCKTAGIECFNYNGEDFKGYDIIVDAILGVGFTGQIRGDIATVIDKINCSGAYVISADIPSGLNCDNGLATVCVRANLTVAINCLKPGYYINDGKDFCGRVLLAPIGIPVEESLGYLVEKQDFKDMFSARAYNSHKGNFGYVAILGGSVSYSGATKLANCALSSLKVGAGVVKLAVPEEIVDSVSPYLIESTLVSMPSKKGVLKYDKKALNQLIDGVKALGFGMGADNGGDNERIVEHLVSNYTGTLVIDADGLNALARVGVEILKRANCKIILTPHVKEFSRLTKYTIEQIQANPINLAMAFAKEYGVTLLLKGSSTIVTNGESVYICDKGCSGMSTAGSGDVLTGVLTGLCGYSTQTTDLIAILGAYICGVAGEQAEKNINSYSMTARDTITYIPNVISDIIKS